MAHRRMDWKKVHASKRLDKSFQDAATTKTPRYAKLLNDWHETRSGGSISNFGGLRLLVVRDKFDLSKWVFYRMPAKNRSGRVVRSSNSFETQGLAIEAAKDFTQPVVYWDLIEPDTNKNFAAGRQ